MPKASDRLEEFDPIKMHFDKFCSGLAFLYPWIFSTYLTAQGGGDVQGLLFSDLWSLLQRHPQSWIKAMSEMCVLPGSCVFWVPWKLFLKKSIWNFYLILYVLVLISESKCRYRMLQVQDAEVLRETGSAGVNAFIYKAHSSMILSSPPGKKDP